MTEQEFIKQVKKVNNPRKHKFAHGYKMRDYYYNFKKHNKNLTETQFSFALHALFGVLFNNLITGKDADLGLNLGKLDVRKRRKKVKFIDGKVVSNLPIDWNATLKLWHSDESCRKKKTLVRCDNEYIFRVWYNKGLAKYINKKFIEFKSSRKLKLALKKAIIEDNLDSFSQYEND